MANCLSKLKRKEQMIRYKKVLKASTKGHFTNIISAAQGLPAGLFRPRPCSAMRSGEKRSAICLARAHFLPNEYNKNLRGDVSVKIGINPNPHDWTWASKATPLLSLPRLGVEGALPSPPGTSHPTRHCPVFKDKRELAPSTGPQFQQRRAGCGDPGSSRLLLGWKDTIPSLSVISEVPAQSRTCLSDAPPRPEGGGSAEQPAHTPTPASG